MARKITIPITDHDSVCNTGYDVFYKKQTDTLWTKEEQFIPPIIISNLIDDTLYDISIVRKCCDGVDSNALEMIINTTILAVPDNFGATPNDSQVGLDWDDVTGATNYVLERATNSDFSENLTEVYSDSTSAYTDTGLTNGTTYYYRVKAQANYHADSDYATLSATPTI